MSNLMENAILHRDLGDEIGSCRMIEVIAAPMGWMVTEEGRLRGSFDNIENAYQKALAICAALFDEGIPARVFQTNARIS